MTRTLSTLKCCPLLQFHPYPSASTSLFSLKFFCTTTNGSDPHSFTVSYLVNNCGFSPETAAKATRRVLLRSNQQPDSILAFFRSHGFSDSQTHGIIRRGPWLLSYNPNKSLLPKFEFLRSKGASTSDIVRILTGSPSFLSYSLQNNIVPAFEFIRGFLQSDHEFIACMIRNSTFLNGCHVKLNVELLVDNGVTRSNIARLFRSWPTILCSPDLVKTVEELKQLGFNPSARVFYLALLAKRTVNKALWAKKVGTYKRWGWSEEHVLQVFKRDPYCMLSSCDKINAVMSFWVDESGWNPLELLKVPTIIRMSLEKRIVPRASVVQFLIAQGLRKKDASVITPFLLTEKLFLQKFVKCFKEDSSHLLKLYEEKMNLADSKEKPEASTKWVNS